MSEFQRVLNRVHNTPDDRDYQYAHVMKLERPAKPLPKYVDVELILPPIWDQGDFGSCTMNAALRMKGMLDKLSGPWKELSRAQGYWSERERNGTTSEDAGASIRDSCDVLVDTGVCLEELWPYRAENIFRKPDGPAFADADARKAVAYFELKTEREWKTSLAHGYPFMFGMDVYTSFMEDEIARTGRMKVPNIHKEKNEGGHALLCTGYDSINDYYWVDNSWGIYWGLKGRFMIPGSVMRDKTFVTDCFTLRMHQGLLLPKPHVA